MNIYSVCVCVPKCQVEWYGDGSQNSINRVKQTHLLSVYLPALTGYTIDAH